MQANQRLIPVRLSVEWTNKARELLAEGVAAGDYSENTAEEARDWMEHVVLDFIERTTRANDWLQNIIGVPRMPHLYTINYPAHDSKGDPKDHITVSIKGKQENLLVGRPEIVDVETKYTTPTGEKKSSKNWHIYTNRIVD